LTYNIIIRYEPGTYKVLWGNGSLLLQSNEDFFSVFQGWAYIGYTSFFRGSKKNTYLNNSYFCESNLSGDFFFSWVVAGVTYKSDDVTAPADATLRLQMQFKDKFGYWMPHFVDVGIIDWSVSVTAECGTDNVFKPFPTLFDLAFEVQLNS
jgi:hypothetical protein